MKTSVSTIVGAQCGRFTIIQKAEPAPSGHDRWLCRCQCGTIKTVRGNNLRRGTTVSCGCYQRELHREVCRRNFTKHGHTVAHKKEHAAWRNMIDRCTKPEHRAYRYYGARGITVCRRWLKSFKAFLQDLGPAPSPAHTLERKQNEGSYEPKNCTWATRAEQGVNRRRCHYLTHNGVTQTATQWARQLGVGPGLILYRIRAGWPAEQIVNTPADSTHTGPRRRKTTTPHVSE